MHSLTPPPSTNQQEKGSQGSTVSGSPSTPNPATRRLSASVVSSTAESSLSSVSSSAEHEPPPCPEDRDYLMAKLMQIEEDGQYQPSSPRNKEKKWDCYCKLKIIIYQLLIHCNILLVELYSWVEVLLSKRLRCLLSSQFQWYHTYRDNCHRDHRYSVIECLHYIFCIHEDRDTDSMPCI